MNTYVKTITSRRTDRSCHEYPDQEFQIVTRHRTLKGDSFTVIVHRKGEPGKRISISLFGSGTRFVAITLYLYICNTIFFTPSKKFF